MSYSLLLLSPPLLLVSYFLQRIRICITHLPTLDAFFATTAHLVIQIVCLVTLRIFHGALLICLAALRLILSISSHISPMSRNLYTAYLVLPLIVQSILFVVILRWTFYILASIGWSLLVLQAFLTSLICASILLACYDSEDCTLTYLPTSLVSHIARPSESALLNSLSDSRQEIENSPLNYFATVSDPLPSPFSHFATISDSLPSISSNNIDLIFENVLRRNAHGTFDINGYDFDDDNGICDFDPSEDILLISSESSEALDAALSFTAYKRVDQKIRPVKGSFPEESHVRRQFPEDPLIGLSTLPTHPPIFVPSNRMTTDQLEMLELNVTGFLLPEEEKLFQHVMYLNREALCYNEADRGTFKESYFSPYIIPTVPHEPWALKNIPIPPGIKDKVIEVLKNKISAGVYEPSQSSYRSRWFCVVKKSGKLRIVHDLQPLNRVTIRDAGLPPNLDTFVEPFAGRACYTVYDLFWGFDARKVAAQCRDMTAFMTPLGLLRITSMPTGFTNFPAEFQQCMVFILQDEIPHVADIFIDDLPIKGPATRYLDQDEHPEVLSENPGIRRFIWEHAVDVHRIMHRITQSGATFSPTKTQICRPEVLIVGQRCTSEGRLPDTSKVDKIKNWPPLTTPKEARAFMGLCGTVRIWIQNYSTLARPITELWRKNVEFEWDLRRQESFQALKDLVSAAPALAPINYTSDRPVILAVDSSWMAVGIILLQIDEEGKRRPARYGSLPFNDREQRYSQPKLELYGLFRALRAFRIHLIGVKNLIVEVDALYIKGMLNEPDMQPNAAINRWIQGILLFDFELVHVAGTKHVGPDALSRRPTAEGETVEEHDDDWLDNIALWTSVYSPSSRNSSTRSITIPYSLSTLPSLVMPVTSRLDNNLRDIHRFLTTLDAPPNTTVQEQKRFIRKSTQFFVKDGRMWKRVLHKPPLLVIFDHSKRITIMIEAHESFGHRGEQATWEHIRLRFYWPHLRNDVRHHVQSCHECQIRSTKKVQVPLTVSTPATIFTKVYVDIMYMPVQRGYRYIIAARDDLSRAAEGKALKVASATELAKFFWEQIYCRYGAIGEVVTDNGPECKGAFEKLLKRMKIPQIRISPYNSKANGVVERGHFTIREAIVKACKGKLQNWPDMVPIAFFADRIATSEATGYSAYYLLHGVDPVLPFDLTESTFMTSGFTSGMSSVDLLALRIQQLQRHPADIAQAAETLRNARFRSKAQFEKRFFKRLNRSTFDKGDLVLVRNTAIEKELNRKTKPRYNGPFEIRNQTPQGSYKLRELNGVQMRRGVVAFRLLPYITRMDLAALSPSEEDKSADEYWSDE